MNTIKNIVPIIVLSTTALIADFRVAPFLQFRSQSRDTARKLVGTTSHHVYLDEWVKGMYFRLYGPVVSNKITLDTHELLVNSGTDAGAYDPGFFTTTLVPIDQMYSTALSYFNGRPLPTTIDDITFAPLQF